MKLILTICTLIGFAFGLAENIIVGNQIQSYKRQQRRKNRDKLIHRAVLQVYSLPAEYRTQALAELQVFMDRLQKRCEDAEAEKKIEEIQKGPSETLALLGLTMMVPIAPGKLFI